MKQFGYFIGLFVILLFLSDYLLTQICDSLYKEVKTGQTGGKINYYLSKPTPEILIMGSSRAFYQIMPDSFKASTFNLSHAGMGQAFQTGLLSVLMANQKLPSTILLHLEPDEFCGNQQNQDIQNLKYYYNKNPKITYELNQLSSFEFLKFSFGLYRFNGRVISLAKNYIQTKIFFKENNGYEPVHSSPRDSLNTIYSANKIQKKDNLNFNYNQANYLIQFISICNTQRVKLICFTSPLFKVTTQSEKTSGILDSLLRANDISYINFLDKPIQELQSHPKYWKDAYHLNHEGSQLESQVLVKEVDAVLEKMH